MYMKRLIEKNKSNLRQVRHKRIMVSGTKDKPRLSVFRGLRSMVAQLIDDQSGKTLCYVKSGEVKKAAVEGRSGKVAIGYLVGKALAEKAGAQGITKAVFDRAGYKYHGRVQAVAEGARDGGIQF